MSIVKEQQRRNGTKRIPNGTSERELKFEWRERKRLVYAVDVEIKRERARVRCMFRSISSISNRGDALRTLVSQWKSSTVRDNSEEPEEVSRSKRLFEP